MHIADFSKGMLGANAIVGASIPLAVGAALSSKYNGTENDSVGVAFFGDVATGQGVLHESMNLASIWKLPVIFVCENNHYAEATPVEYAVSIEDISDRAAAYSMPGVTADGMDVFDVYEVAGEAVNRARKGDGPTLIELKTFRYHGHFHADDPKKYRTPEEDEKWKDRDCLKIFEEKVIANNSMDLESIKKIKDLIDTEMIEAVEFAEKSPMPNIEELYSDVYVKYKD